MTLFHVRLLGVNAANGEKLLLSAAVVGGVLLIRYLIVWIVRLVTGEQPNERVAFWTRQGASLIATIVGAVVLISIWFEDTTRLTTAVGLIGAGLAFALQKVVTAFAGYLVILRGKTFTVGDRITMGGVRGDVISLGFLQTRIMEMGEPPAAQSDSDKILGARAAIYRARRHRDERQSVRRADLQLHARIPVHLGRNQDPIGYKTDRRVAETILLDCAREATADIADASKAAHAAIEQRYFIDFGESRPSRVLRDHGQLGRAESPVRLADPWHPVSQGRTRPAHSRAVRARRHRDRQWNVQHHRIPARTASKARSPSGWPRRSHARTA